MLSNNFIHVHLVQVYIEAEGWTTHESCILEATPKLYKGNHETSEGWVFWIHVTLEIV